MESLTQNLRPDERASNQLRALFESRGYRRVRPGRFEDYALYVENKNFLQSEQIITFMDMNGKLLALKPDVTLSVIKNIPDTPLPTFQKLYYLDEVYRVSKENRSYQAVSQIGVELAGPTDVFAGIEVIDLALLSLEAIGETYLLDISHLGFLSGFLEEWGIGDGGARAILKAIQDKNPHALAEQLEALGLPKEAADQLKTLADLHGELTTALDAIGGMVRGQRMQAAYDELRTVAQALGYNGFSGKVNLDFSVAGDLDYYNGILFRGYVEGLPRSVLSGGRYDNLMARMGKASGAAGFAVSLDELGRIAARRKEYDVDLLITYDGDSDWAALLRTVKELTAQGMAVRLERADGLLAGADFTFRTHRHFQKDRLAGEGESIC